MNKFGYDIEHLLDDQAESNRYLSSYLNNGCLGLLLGAGVSMGFGLPSWNTLVEECFKVKFPGERFNSSASTVQLKNISQRIKDQCQDEEYLELIRGVMYKNVDFDFTLAKKDLLIAIMSLTVGRTRPRVKQIITYNFDSVLEWYLKINGLNVVISQKKNLFNKDADVEITHLHGYLPHDDKHGASSEKIVFSKDEFEDREVQYEYWKTVFDEFCRRNIFLTVGLSAASIQDDICKYLRNLDQWYLSEKLLRNQPYGFAYLTPSTTIDQKQYLLKHGVIPITYEKDNIPNAIFKIAQGAIVNEF